MTAYMTVPLAARGRAVGTLLLVSADPTRRLDAELLALAEAFATRAAVAIDNARMYREAQRAARTREDFLMVASHELRTPLTSLQIAVQALLRKATAADERPPAWSVPLLRAVERSVIRLGSLVDDLLDFSHFAGGPPVPQSEDVDLRDVVSEVVQGAADLLARAGCEVRATSRGTTQGSWDRRWLLQIVGHLVSNAIKHGKGAMIEVDLEGDDDVVALAVRDHGAGIAVEDRSRIFEQFTCSAPTEHPPSGLGLGLWLVRRMVDGLGGTVDVESSPGLGATFTVTLPRRRTRQGSSHAAE
jgi:signal transduction histidine kinase